MQIFAAKLRDSKEWSSGDIRVTSPDNKGRQDWRYRVTEHKSLTVELLLDKQQRTKNEIWNERNWRTYREWFPQFGWVYFQVQMIQGHSCKNSMK